LELDSIPKGTTTVVAEEAGIAAVNSCCESVGRGEPRCDRRKAVTAETFARIQPKQAKFFKTLREHAMKDRTKARNRDGRSDHAGRLRAGRLREQQPDKPNHHSRRQCQDLDARQRLARPRDAHHAG
jgi:hypothetical protein